MQIIKVLLQKVFQTIQNLTKNALPKYYKNPSNHKEFYINVFDVKNNSGWNVSLQTNYSAIAYNIGTGAQANEILKQTCN